MLIVSAPPYCICNSCLAGVTLMLSMHNNNNLNALFSQGLLLRAWIDITSGKESYAKKSIKMFDEVLSG